MRKTALIDLAAAAVWVGCIYAAIPCARLIQQYVRDTFGDGFFVWAALTLAGACLTAALIRLRRSGLREKFSVVAAALIYGAAAWHLRARPEEALHLVEYGILALLLVRALRHGGQDRRLFPAAAALAAFFGVLDEIIQWYIPRRFFDFRDLCINFAGAMLMLLAMAWGLRWPPAGAPATLRSRRRFYGSLALAWAALAFCLLNTPARQARLARWIPAIGAVDDVMIEYGYMHRTPAGARFPSRLTRAELERVDAADAAAHAALIAPFNSPRDYEEFLTRHPGWSQPFIHEMRVRLFRRDRYLRQAARQSDAARAAGDALTIVWHENRILETCFSNTLRAAGKMLESGDRDRARRLADHSPGYVSPVGAHLVTAVGERQVQALVVLSGLAILAAGLGQCRRRSDPSSHIAAKPPKG